MNHEGRGRSGDVAAAALARLRGEWHKHHSHECAFCVDHALVANTLAAAQARVAELEKAVDVDKLVRAATADLRARLEQAEARERALREALRGLLALAANGAGLTSEDESLMQRARALNDFAPTPEPRHDHS